LSVSSGVLIFSLSRRLRAQRLELERNRRAHLMYEAAVRMSGTLEAPEIYAGLRDLTAQAIPFDGLIVSSYEADSRRVRCEHLWVNGQALDHTALPVLPID